MSRYAKRKDTAMLKEIGFAVLAAMGIHGCALGVEPVQFEAPDLASPVEWAALEVAEHVEPEEFAEEFATRVSFEEPERFAEEFAADDSPEQFAEEVPPVEETADEVSPEQFAEEPAEETGQFVSDDSPEVYVDEVTGDEYSLEELTPGCGNPPDGAAWCDSCGEMYDESEVTTEISCPECGIDGPVCDSCAEWHETEAHAE